MDIPGRLHPVDVYFSPHPEPNYLDAAIRTSIQIHCYEDPGDILVFLTGEEEIENAVRAVQEQVYEFGDEVGTVDAIPLYSSLPPQ